MNSFVRYINPGISFILFSLHFSRGERYISLDSNCIVTITKSWHIRVVILLPSCYWIPKYYSTGSWQNLSVKMHMQPFWRKSFAALTVDLTAICMPWNVCKYFRSDILREITWLALSIFFPCIRIWKELICHPGEFFVSFINIWFQIWLVFLLIFFPNFLHWGSQKPGLTFVNISLFRRVLLYQKFGEF